MASVIKGMNRYLCGNFLRMPRKTNINNIIVLAILAGFIFVISACQKKDEVSTEPSFQLTFSTDTIIFDTVFTTIGSVTQYLKVYNPNDSRVNISNISLAEGNQSQYQINVDGASGTSINDVEIASGDSLFVFVKVSIDPNNSNSPLIVSDSILFLTNGNQQDVNLVAWGQDADYFIGNKYIQGLNYPYTIIARENIDTTWIDDKPKVIYGWAVVDSAASLTIGPGCNIHFHQNSGLWVYKGGSIHVNGEKDSLVTFQGDRLDYQYRDLPGQWDRIWINEGSENNVFNYAVIKNGFIGIQAETLESGTGNVLILNNTRIENMSRWGLFTMFYNVYSTNSVFANCAENTLFLTIGGEYDFRHCTFANYWSSSIRQEPSFTLSNHIIVYDANGNPILKQGDLNAYFGNSIIYGNLDEELLFAEEPGTDFIYKFDYCDFKTEMEISDEGIFENCFKNIDPIFVDYSENNFRLDSLSGVIDSGNMQVIETSVIDITMDLDNNPRTEDIAPDLGAYEYIPE